MNSPRVGKWVVFHVFTGWRPLKRQPRTTYGCMTAGQSPLVWAWSVAYA